MIYIGLDDTDNADSRGTGRLARDIAATLAKQHKVIAVTRHQLLVDPRVPYVAQRLRNATWRKMRGESSALRRCSCWPTAGQR
jgi:hypothetical protein